jgi:hypothetical protein
MMFDITLQTSPKPPLLDFLALMHRPGRNIESSLRSSSAMRVSSSRISADTEPYPLSDRL